MPDNEISQHLVILSISLFIVHLIVIAYEAVEHEKVAHVGDSYRRNCNWPSALDQFVTASATV